MSLFPENFKLLLASVYIFLPFISEFLCISTSRLALGPFEWGIHILSSFLQILFDDWTGKNMKQIELIEKENVTENTAVG